MYHVFMVSANNKNKCQFCQPDHLLASNSLVEAQIDVPCKQICFLAKIVCKTNMSKKRLVLFGLVFFHCCFIQIDTILKILFPFCIAYVHKLLPQKKMANKHSSKTRSAFQYMAGLRRALLVHKPV